MKIGLNKTGKLGYFKTSETTFRKIQWQDDHSGL